MLIVTLFGLLLACFCLLMAITPVKFASGILSFSRLPYFHIFEIFSRLVVGILFIATADQTLSPALITVIGCGLIAVGIGLVFTPPSKHRQFAVWSAQKFQPYFRVLGIVALPLAFALIWIAQGK